MLLSTVVYVLFLTLSEKRIHTMNQNVSHLTIYSAAIAALKGQFVGHCHHSIVFSKGPQTFFGNLLG